MKFRNYCLVIIGNSVGIQAEIEKISETKPNILDGKGLVIATFTSAVSPSELQDWFKLNKRNFLVFDLTTENSGFFIDRPSIHEGLFGFLKTMNLDDKSEELLREINLTSNTRNNRVSVKSVLKEIKKPKITEKDIAKMSKNEKEEMWNKIMDNGVENMTEQDKKILQFLSK